MGGVALSGGMPGAMSGALPAGRIKYGSGSMAFAIKIFMDMGNERESSSSFLVLVDDELRGRV